VLEWGIPQIKHEAHCIVHGSYALGLSPGLDNADLPLSPCPRSSNWTVRLQVVEIQ
jgi:hypothetical protein